MAKTRLRPLGNRVILRKIEDDNQRGIRRPAMSDQSEESGSQEYEVIESLTSIVQRGDRVYLARHKGWKIETNDDEELYAADVDDILAVEEDVEEGGV